MFLKMCCILLSVGCFACKAGFDIAPAKKPTNPSLTPDYEGSNSPEAGFKHHELSAKSTHALREQNSAGELVTTSAVKRPQIKVSRHERLIQQADKIVQNPENVLKATVDEQEETEEVEDIQTHTCEESADIQEITYEQNLMHIQGVQKRRFFKKCHLHYAGGDSGSNWYENHALPQVTRDHHHTNGSGTHYCNCLYNVYDFYERKVNISIDGKITPLEKEEWKLVQKDYEEKREEFPEKVKEHISLKTVEDESKDTWSALPEIPEDLEHSCEIKEKVCTSGPVSIVVGGHTITRPCIQWKTTYVCYNDQVNTCAALRLNPTCHQLPKSECIQKIKERCVRYKHTFECSSLKTGQKKLAMIEGISCLDGKCLKQMEWSHNQDFGEVISKLSAFSHMSKDMNAHTGHVFSGTSHKCNRECAGFKDCCKRFKGWGVDIGFASCSAEEKLLSELRSKKRCVYVGSFCAEKVLGVCIRKKLSFCCFGSILARLIHEQGRGQLGIGWGDGEHPNCQPFTIEQLTRLNFDQMNFSEITSDLVGKMSVPDTKKITERFVGDWKDRLPAVGEINPASKHDSEKKNIMKDALKVRQERIKNTPGEYTLNQDGEKGGDNAELVF